jgi:hypothetical protein
MTQVIGGGVVVLLVIALLAREACVIGAVSAGRAVRRALDLSIVVLAGVFVTVVSIHLVGLS